MTFCDSSHFFLHLPGFSERGTMCISQWKRPCEMYETCERGLVHPLIFLSNYFHKESTLSEKSADTHPFSWIPHALYSRISRPFQSTRKKDNSFSYCEEIFPNFFEYKLWREVIMVGGPMSWPQLLSDQQLPTRSSTETSPFCWCQLTAF
jgi:hypothetical protein